MDASKRGRHGKERVILLKESWFCMVKREHTGQWPEKPCVMLKFQSATRFKVSFKHSVESCVHSQGYGDRLFQHERVQSWRSSTDSRLQPAELLRAGALTYMCGSHKGENGALCSTSVGQLSFV